MPAPPMTVRTTKPRRKTAGLTSKYRPSPPATPARMRSEERSRRFTDGWVMVISLMSAMVLSPRSLHHGGCPWSDPDAIGVGLSGFRAGGCALPSLPMAEKTIAENRRARHDYQLLERVEAGIALTGTEV